MSDKRPALAILKPFTLLFCVLFFHLIHFSETVASTAIIAPGAADSMTTEQLAAVGEIIIFGRVGGFKARSTDGKGQCSLCHVFGPNDIVDRAPNLFGITRTSAERIKDPRYLKPDTVQIEAFKGSGRATTAEEYMAESHICPSCFVVAGFGIKGTKINDQESPMPAINKPPISLTIDEQVAVDTWLFINDGEEPPPPKVIRAAHEKFIPEADRYREEPPVSLSAGTPIRLSGEVTGVDAQTKTVTVKVKDKEVKLTVTDRTNIIQGKSKKRLVDIQTGAKVVAFAIVEEGDKMTAKFISIAVEKEPTSAPAPAPEKK